MFSFSFLLDRCHEHFTFSDFCKGTNIEETAGWNGSKYKHLFSSSRQLSLLREDVKCCATVLQGVLQPTVQLIKTNRLAQLVWQNGHEQCLQRILCLRLLTI